MWREPALWEVEDAVSLDWAAALYPVWSTRAKLCLKKKIVTMDVNLISIFKNKTIILLYPSYLPECCFIPFCVLVQSPTTH